MFNTITAALIGNQVWLIFLAYSIEDGFHIVTWEAGSIKLITFCNLKLSKLECKSAPEPPVDIPPVKKLWMFLFNM